jgi:nitrogen PTS system EIIA component
MSTPLQNPRLPDPRKLLRPRKPPDPRFATKAPSADLSKIDLVGPGAENSFVSYQTFTLEEVARYLHMSEADIEGLLQDEAIPVETRGDRWVFRKSDIDAWASQRILGLTDRGLADYHQKSLHGTRPFLEHEAIMPELIRPGFIDAAMTAKTKASALRGMVALAEKTGLVYDAKDLLVSLEAREELCSTAIPGGLALLHPRHHEPFMFESSFVVLGRPVQEIHYGAPDGQPTNLFFLICCQDDRLHLHTLARLCLMAQKTPLLDELRLAAGATAMFELIITCETQVLETRKTGSR